MESPILRIASRESALALWQTNVVMASLQSLGYPAQLVPFKTTGDVDLVSPIYAMGVTGVFTKELDTALLSNTADIAVHSLKDIPTVLPEGLSIAAVLKRASAADVLIGRPGFDADTSIHAAIATSSIRRRSQWLHRYPQHTMVNVRGNVATRLEKFTSAGWDGIIFARAGLERLGLLPEKYIQLNWMTPAPAQGAIAVVCRTADERVYSLCRKINHDDSETRVRIEREFLFHLDGGCSVPISALVEIRENTVYFNGTIHSLDGTKFENATLTMPRGNIKQMGAMAADIIRSSPQGKAILSEFRTLQRSSTKPEIS